MNSTGRFDTLLRRVGELAERCPDKAAVIFKGETLTYAGLFRRALNTAAVLKEQGVLPGDRVCFSAVSRPETVIAYLAVHACGGVTVCLDKGAAPEHMAEIFAVSGARLLLTDKPMKEAGEGCRVLPLRGTCGEPAEGARQAEGTRPESLLPADAELPADILFTTGTTGKPKGVILSHRAVYHILDNTIRGCGYSDRTVMLLPLPLNHSFALRVLRAVLYCGGTVVLQNGFTFAKEAEKNILEYGCNAAACVPASCEVLKSQMQDAFRDVMSRLDILEVSAGPLSAARREELVRLLPGVRIMNVWGSSESGGAIFCDVNEAVKDSRTAGSLGRALDGVEVMFLSASAPFDCPERMRGHLRDWQAGSDAAHPGRMAIRGDMVMSGYWEAPEKTAETLIDGWLVTGDMAYGDREGNLFMLGRADDLINMGGEKISPVEIENDAGRYEHIRDCACIGADDVLLGQVPVLFVVTGLGYDEKAFRQWLGGKIEKNRLPRAIVTVEEIPRNRMMKTDRAALRKMWENRDALALMNPVVNAILSRRSVRRFTDREIPRETLDLLLRCGYHAPSGHNMQSWRFTVLTKEEDIRRLKEAAVSAAKENRIPVYGFENPKAMILISNDSRNPDGCQDASCAAENIMLAAQSLGLGSVWLNMLMKLRHAEPVKTLLDGFGIPDTHIVWASVALGWPVAEAAGLQKNPDVVRFVE